MQSYLAPLTVRPGRYSCTRYRKRPEYTDRYVGPISQAQVGHHAGMVDVLEALCDVGHVASAQKLASLGLGRRTLSSLVRTGFIQRVARGVYACTHLDSGRLQAARAGGAIDCLTVLQQHAVWSGINAPGLHLRMDSRYHQKHLIPGSVVHWAATHAAPTTTLEVAPLDALLMAIACLPPDDALACVESALHLRFIGEEDYVQLLTRTPSHHRRIVGAVDRGAQSGYETHTRVTLLRAGFRVTTQFFVAGAGHFDLLVNDCVAVETDGEKWHGPERFIPDRTKDLIAEGQNIRVLRIGRPHIFEWWPQTLHTITQMVDGAERGSPSRNRRPH